MVHYSLNGRSTSVMDTVSTISSARREFKIEPSWKAVLQNQFESAYMLSLRQFICDALASKKTIYPPLPKIFAAFDATPFDAVKVVILGQDPYHGPRQAHGLSFSVPDGVAIPPSLVNIFKELSSDLNVPQFKLPPSGNLMSWARQGVLLLNAVLSVEANKPGSHQKKGWEIFTDTVIQTLNNQKEHLVFLLWGSDAKSKGALVDQSKHLVLTSSHPSPLSVYRGFSGCKHFSKTNDYLKKCGIKPIDWLKI